MWSVVWPLLLALAISVLAGMEIRRERWEHNVERATDHVRVIRFVEAIAHSGPDRTRIAIPEGWTPAEAHRLLSAFGAARDRLTGGEGVGSDPAA